MIKSCAILGASGHGLVIAEIAELNGFNNIVFFDDLWPSISFNLKWPVLGNTSSLKNTISNFDIVVIAIGDNNVRYQKYLELKACGANFDSLIHPSAIVSSYTSLGRGTVVMPCSVINSNTIIGNVCIINTGSTIDHDCHIGNSVHVSPGSNIAGNVRVGHGSWMGIGCQVIHGISIGDNVVVGAGATVVNDIIDNVTVVGTPAKYLNDN